MKKTLFVLFALAAPAVMAMTDEEAAQILSSSTVVTNDTYTFSANQSAFTAIAIVDLDAYAALRPTLTTNNHPIVLSFTDSENHVMGAILGDTRYTYNALITTSLGTADRGSWQTLNNIGLSGAQGDDLYIGNATSAAITLSYDRNNGTYLTFSFMSKSGELVTATRNDGDLRYSGASRTLSTLTMNPDLFTKVYVMEGTKYTGADIAMLTQKALPEPATATLSLLALAGLAARRRRH
ncbi:MAG: hypothetical protein MJ051_07810 [Akkermansia sp.]|nr:hypothetical protein [Akkermansia sp.]